MSVIIPSNATNPTLTTRRIAGCYNGFDKRLNKIRHETLKMWGDVGATEIQVNEVIYSYNLTAQGQRDLMRNISALIDRIMMTDENGNLVTELNLDQLWLTSEFVVPSYNQGTTQAINNIGNQSPIYAATRQSISDLLFSEPYQRRINNVASREFELMTGFNDTLKKNLSVILSDGIALGLNPRDVAKNIYSEFGETIKKDGKGATGAKARAARIARTEVPTALRRARRDEAVNASQEFGLKIKMLWISALSPTTRRNHASRHANLYTVGQVDEFYTKNGNSINCKCGQVEAVLDDEGNPVAKTLDKRRAQMKRTYEEKRSGFALNNADCCCFEYDELIKPWH